MQLRMLLSVNAVLAILHGLGFILLPEVLLDLYQVSLAPGASLMGQLFGAELLVVAVICWKARDFSSPDVLAAVVLANLVADVVGTVISVRATVNGIMGSTGWLAVAIYGLLAIAYLLVVVRKGYRSGAAA